MDERTIGSEDVMSTMDTVAIPIPPPQLGRRRRFSSEEKRRFLTEAEQPGETVSSVGRRYGLSVSLLFRWRRQLGGATAKERPPVEDTALVDAKAKRADDVRRLRDQIRDLQRLLGKKTLENELLREQLRNAQGEPRQPAQGFEPAEGRADGRA